VHGLGHVPQSAHLEILRSHPPNRLAQDDEGVVLAWPQSAHLEILRSHPPGRLWHARGEGKGSPRPWCIYFFSMMNLPKATPTWKPEPLPVRARWTSPLVMAMAEADLPAPASAELAT
jgi:hypothetical protein